MQMLQMLQTDKGYTLITGGSGFVGRHLSKVLRTPHLLVLSRKARTDIPCITGDLTAQHTLKQLAKRLANYRITTVIHLAALIPTPANSADAFAHMRSNLEATMHLIHALPKTVKHFIFTSTGDVYGTPRKLPITEDHPTHPITHYAVSKLAAEHFLRVACKERAISLTILRSSQVYGPGEPVVKAIPIFISQFLKGEPPVLYGNPNDVRDYVYVSDLANAIALAAESEKSGTYNISGGKPYRIGNVLAKIKKLTRSPLTPQKAPTRREPFISYYSIRAATRDLGYTPEVSLTEGLRKEIAWFKEAMQK